MMMMMMLVYTLMILPFLSGSWHPFSSLTKGIHEKNTKEFKAEDRRGRRQSKEAEGKEVK